ncbi:hypothetical protein LEP1GSC188_0768 [Leptospira weilii serovar Topaz str. LT2116]|uniref:Uncharacterized protein n=1 Tax=Leptospira weilii serovar Topaz str. LT2116 TaxID=1088540 RepID=M3FNN9_9LEPT|nr:hypothetical protein LEP1GSC188_0768 [Leptospira weilii serovar Topaz str. LT2116]
MLYSFLVFPILAQTAIPIFEFYRTEKFRRTRENGFRPFSGIQEFITDRFPLIFVHAVRFETPHSDL